MLTITALIFFAIGTILTLIKKKPKLIWASFVIAYTCLLLLPIWNIVEYILLVFIYILEIIGFINELKR